MSDLISHQWMQGPVATKQEIREEFGRRREVMRNQRTYEGTEKLGPYR